MFNQNFKVMKQKIFTLVMMLALVIMAGSAFGQATNVVQGGKYSYTLSNVKIAAQPGTVAINYTGSGETIDNVEHNSVAYTLTAGSFSLTSTANGSLTFDVTYADDSDGDIEVTVTDGGTGGCFNKIILTITVQPAPIVDATIAGVAAFCQDKGAATTNSSEADNAGSLSNSFNYTVTVSITNPPADYDGTLSIALSGTGATNLAGISIVGISGAAPTGVSYLAGVLTWDESTPLTSGSFEVPLEVTFTTTEGFADQTITATLSSVSVTENSGNENYPEAVPAQANNDDDVTVYAMPSIGSFN
jgi:hypothetical protein